MVQSFSKKGHHYDNAVVESFFKFLKREQTNRRNYQNLKELESSVFQYIEGYYNSKRPHSTLNYLTPNQAEFNFHSSLGWRRRTQQLPSLRNNLLSFGCLLGTLSPSSSPYPLNSLMID
ncbi:MAG: integrase core domain-containing protein [Firmicutes bacterium]|nr:integrase core domain-containing protein [Bacillota bacterium]